MSDSATVARARLRDGAREVTGAWLAPRLLGSLPRRLALTVGDFGSVTLSWEGYGATAALGGEAFALSRGREVGRLVLDAALAGRVVAVALGAEAALAPHLGRLGPGARGVVAGFVASVLDAAGAPLAVSLEPAGLDGTGTLDAVVVSIGVAAVGGAGWAALEVPAGWLDDAARLPSDPRELEALAIDASVQLARTTLSAGELSALAPGDAVVFDGEAALAPEATWPARLVVGGHAASALVAADGILTMTGGFRPTGVRPAGGAAASAGRGDTTALVALPVGVVAELARVRLRGDELVTLEAGTAISLGGARLDGVVLLAEDQPWAEGELVDVEGELGVRVTRRLR
jgi:flagellar motor switch/type III secretory pathway protein FliN